MLSQKVLLNAIIKLDARTFYVSTFIEMLLKSEFNSTYKTQL